MARVRLLVVAAAAVLAVGSFVPSYAQVNSDRARKALTTPIKELSVENVPMSRVVDHLREFSGANIVVNWKVLESAGIAKDTPITLNVRELTLRKMLRLVLDQAGTTSLLVFNVSDNVIEVTTQEDADRKMITKVYVVDDLVMTNNNPSPPPQIDLNSATRSGTTSGGNGGGMGISGGGGGIFKEEPVANNNDDSPQKRGDDLAKMIRDIVRPNIWKENGGNASIVYFSGKLIVTAPQSVHEAIGGPVAPEGGQRFGM